MTTPLCPIHKVPLEEEELWRRDRFTNVGLPIQDNYLHYHCKQCPRREWVIIDGCKYYNYQNNWELMFSITLKPRKKGILIGDRVYQI